MYSYLFSVPSCSGDNSFEFTLEGNFYPTKDYICNYLYGELDRNNSRQYNKIMSVINIIKNEYPAFIDKHAVIHTQQIERRGASYLTMSVRRK